MVKQQKEMPQEGEMKQEMVAEAKLDTKQLEGQALDRVLKALNMSKADLEALEQKKVTDQEMVEYNIFPIEVTINGRAVPMKGRATRVEAETILSVAGQLRERLMQEQLSKEGQAIIMNGTIQSRIVRTTDLLGQEVSV